jgi:hypothetical protein
LGTLTSVQNGSYIPAYGYLIGVEILDEGQYIAWLTCSCWVVMPRGPCAARFSYCTSQSEFIGVAVSMWRTPFDTPHLELTPLGRLSNGSLYIFFFFSFLQNFYHCYYIVDRVFMSRGQYWRPITSSFDSVLLSILFVYFRYIFIGLRAIISFSLHFFSFESYIAWHYCDGGCL